MISKANTTGRYMNKTQPSCCKSLYTGPRKFVKMLGIASASLFAIIGSDFFFPLLGVSVSVLEAKRLGPWMVPESVIFVQESMDM